MSKKVDKDYFYDNKEELDDEDRKCPPRLVPSMNQYQVWAASHKPEGRTSAPEFEDDPHEHGIKLQVDIIAQKREADAIEEAVLVDEKAMIKGGPDGHVLVSHSKQLWASNDDSNTTDDTFGDKQYYKLGTEVADIQGQPSPNVTEERQSRPKEVTRHGAFREGGPDIEEGYEEDEFTITYQEENERQTPAATDETLIDPVCAELVNTDEEQRHLQEQINQALQRERQKAVVAEATPITDKRKKWFILGAISVIVVTVTTVLAVKLPKEPSHCGEEGYFGPKCDLHYPNCSARFPDSLVIGNGLCDLAYNTSECGWEGRDCLPCDYGYFGLYCSFYHPNCSVDFPESIAIGNGICDVKYNTTECERDGGDCLPCEDGYYGLECNLYYPNCDVPLPEYIGDGFCDGEPYSTVECGWDGGDCCPPGYFGPYCTLFYPNCSAVDDPLWIDIGDPSLIGNGFCEGLYNTSECGWEGGDCLPCDDGYFGLDCTLFYPNCSASYPESMVIGDGLCDGLYNTEECGWEGGDCCLPGYFGPGCSLHYPNCSADDPSLIGDDWCDDVYNTSECGWEGGDCLPCEDGYFGPSCEHYPDCSVPNPELIGNGECDGLPYETEECRWDGGDCVSLFCGEHGYFGEFCDLFYPNCSVPIPSYIGDLECDGLPYNTEECGWDGGDCHHCNATYFGPSCDLYYPNCSVPIPSYIGNGACNGKPYDTLECGWDGGDCISCDVGYVGPNCSHYYPNCSVSFPKFIGNGICNRKYNTTECGWDGADCLPCDDGYFGPGCKLYYPNCSVPIPSYIGDRVCDGLPFNTEECGWDGGDCCPPGGDCIV